MEANALLLTKDKYTKKELNKTNIKEQNNNRLHRTTKCYVYKIKKIKIKSYKNSNKTKNYPNH